MPWLPGNAGGFAMLGFGLWNYEYAVFGTEIAFAIVGLGLYCRWAATTRPSPRWYVGPIIIAVLFIAQIAGDIPRLP